MKGIIHYMPLRLPILLAIALSALASPATSTTILARCGPSAGQSYYFEGGIVGPGQGGWKKDGFDGGRITAWIDDKNNVDVIVRDTVGTRSYRRQGYSISLTGLDAASRAFLLTAQGQNFVETFLFKTNEIGVGTVVWTSSKTASLIAKTSIMVAECGPSFTLDQ